MRTIMIGVGEVGCAFFQALSQQGVVFAAVADKRLSPRAAALCEQFNTPVIDDARTILRNADLVLSCVEGETSELIAELVAREGHAGQVLVDFSTASTDSKKRSAAKLRPLGIEFVDVAIMGAIALTGAKTNMLAAGVTPASEPGIALLQKGGLPISTLPQSQAGDAISLKLLRSVFTKGLEALTVECLAAAEHLGIRHALYDVLADIDRTPLPEFLEMLVRTHIVHASRRQKEVARAHEQMSDLGLESVVLPAVHQAFERTTQHQTGAQTDMPTTERALEMLIDICKNQTPSAKQTLIA